MEAWQPSDAGDCTGRENPIPGSGILTRGSEIKADGG